MLGHPPKDLRSRSTWLALFVVAGVNHFLNTGFYVGIMPPCLPWHLELVYISGVALVIPARHFPVLTNWMQSPWFLKARGLE